MYVIAVNKSQYFLLNVHRLFYIFQVQRKGFDFDKSRCFSTPWYTIGKTEEWWQRGTERGTKAPRNRRREGLWGDYKKAGTEGMKDGRRHAVSPRVRGDGSVLTATYKDGNWEEWEGNCSFSSRLVNPHSWPSPCVTEETETHKPHERPQSYNMTDRQTTHINLHNPALRPHPCNCHMGNIYTCHMWQLVDIHIDNWTNDEQLLIWFHVNI